jgi:hypothetical protein
MNVNVMPTWLHEANLSKEVSSRRKRPKEVQSPGPIDGRPHFAKRSIDDGKQEKIAAIDPDFDRGQSLCP